MRLPSTKYRARRPSTRIVASAGWAPGLEPAPVPPPPQLTSGLLARPGNAALAGKVRSVLLLGCFPTPCAGDQLSLRVNSQLAVDVLKVRLDGVERQE